MIKEKKRPKVKTTPLNFRIPVDILESIKEVSDSLGMNTSDWIKMLLSNELVDMEEEDRREATQSYIELKIGEEEFKDATGYSEVPEAIRNAQQKVIDVMADMAIIKAKARKGSKTGEVIKNE